MTDMSRGSPRLQDDGDRSAEIDLLLPRGEKPSLGAHLVTPRVFYTHHGIYVGDGRVIHYSGLVNGIRRGQVEEVLLEDFSEGHGVRVRGAPRYFGRNEVVARARSRLGERSYRVFSNNCEHFCTWALGQDSHSEQIERLLQWPLTIFRAIRA